MHRTHVSCDIVLSWGACFDEYEPLVGRNCQLSVSIYQLAERLTRRRPIASAILGVLGRLARRSRMQRKFWDSAAYGEPEPNGLDDGFGILT